MAATIYSLCALMSLGVAVLLWRHYLATRSRLLFWSAVCFGGLTLNNVALVVDKLFWSGDLGALRQIIALVSVSLLLFGLIYEEE